jgi:hypothetical protein
MKKKPRAPSFSQVMVTDYAAFFAALLPILVWLVYLAWLLVRRGLNLELSAQVVNYVSFAMIGLTVAAVAYQFWRFWSIRRLLLKGSEVTGRIATVHWQWMGGKVVYKYSFGSKRLESSARVRHNKHTGTLRKGGRVLLVVDRSNPRRALIREIYY